MRNIFLTIFFFLALGAGLANASSETEKAKSDSTSMETVTETVVEETETVVEEVEYEESEVATEKSESPAIIEIRINGDKLDMEEDMWWKLLLMGLFLIVTTILVVRTFKGDSNV